MGKWGAGGEMPYTPNPQSSTTKLNLYENNGIPPPIKKIFPSFTQDIIQARALETEM